MFHSTYTVSQATAQFCLFTTRLKDDFSVCNCSFSSCPQDRTNILAIHTKEWRPRLKHSFLMQLSELTVGYCGADLKALCTETALAALRRTFPQIYRSSEKLIIDPEKICMQPQDFLRAMERITPASQRVEVSPAKSLSPTLHRLLSRQLREILSTLIFIFPAAWKQLEKANHIYAPSRTDSCCVSATPNSISSPAVGGRSKEAAATSWPLDLLQNDHLSTSSAQVSAPLRDKTFALSLSRSELSNAHHGGVILNGGTTASRRNAHSSFSVESILSTPEKLRGCLEHTDASSHHRKDSTDETPSSSHVTVTAATSRETSLTFLGQSFSANREQVYFDSTSFSGTELGVARMDIYEEEEKEESHSRGGAEGVDTPIITQEVCQSTPPLRALTLTEGADPHRLPTISRSRLLLCGQPLMGQTEHIGPALLHVLEGFTQHVLDMSALYSVAMRTPEEACHQVGTICTVSITSVLYSRVLCVGCW